MSRWKRTTAPGTATTTTTTTAVVVASVAFWEAECSGGEAVAGPFGRQPDRNDLVNDGCGAGKSHRCRFAVDRFVAAPQKHDAQRRGVIRKNCVHHHTVPGRRGFLSRWVCSPPWNATRPLLRERRQRLPPFHLSTRPSPPQKKRNHECRAGHRWSSARRAAVGAARSIRTDGTEPEEGPRGNTAILFGGLDAFGTAALFRLVQFGGA
mmetsp:Transcript_23508/g.52069  ORF Transcript_23508/g.52069 Transcript_23508/m.52069 type:complete len:208 (-) Transcript_23508:222-845(-)